MDVIATACFIITLALGEEGRGDTEEMFIYIMCIPSLVFIAVGALSTIHAFKQK